MTTRVGSVNENNQSATTTLSGRLDTGSLAGMVVVGVHFAGRQPGNVGTPFEGIFGTLQVNSDGSFTYLLNNNDLDTDLLATGEQAFERFVITFRIGGIEQTLAVDIAINGIDEPGQVRLDYAEPVSVIADTEIAPDTQVRFSSSEGFRDTNFTSDSSSIMFENRGWLGGTSLDSQPFISAVSLPVSSTINRGRITVGTADIAFTSAVGVIGAGENHGVVSSSVASGFDVNGLAGRAEGWAGVSLNTGLIEVISAFDALGTTQVAGNNFTNTGLIYVEGGSGYTSANRVDPLGIIAYRSGGTDIIDNQGTVYVVSNTPFVRSVGFSFFPNSTNIYSPSWFDNSGTIVADRAIIALDGFQTSMLLTNSGHIEGTLELDRGVNQIANTATGTWFGDWTLAIATPDLVDNAGEIVGAISLRGGDDFYRSAPGGTVTGLVSGGAGNDALQGGDGDDRLAGDEGQDWLFGGGGADQLTGGSGADVFVYRSVSESTAAQRDTITDFQSGSDRIDISAIGATDFTLTASGGNTILRATTASGTLEVLVSGAVSSSDIVNQPASATLTGTSGNDLLMAVVNGSTLSAGAGNDALHGTAGNDVLDGGTGADTMYGGAGNDIFIHDNSSDLIVEGENGGIDEVQTSIGLILPTFVEIGRLLGTADTFLSGNEFDNILIGNAGNNVLRGGGGNNTLIGGLGIDTLYMNIGNHTAVYNSVQESQRGNADILFFFDSADDRVDLSAFDVQYFTMGEYTRRPETSGAGFFNVDMTVVSVMTAQGELVVEIQGTPTLDAFLWQRPAGTGATLFGLDLDDRLFGGSDNDTIDGRGGNDDLRGMDGADILTGGLGNDTLDGGGNVDTAVVRGVRSAYTVTQTATGVFQVVGPDGTDVLTAIEFLQFDDQVLRLRPGTGVSVNFETADPSVYQSTMNAIRDFDGNVLGGNGSWLRIGSADVNGDGDIDQILVNDALGRFATVGTAPDGLVYFSDHGWAGETRVAGIYIDPQVAAGIVEAGSPNDSQRRFQNDLLIENINRVLGADDYDGNGEQEVFFALTDGTAYLRALMHADGNIRYANYQSEQEVIDYLTANGFGPETWEGWFTSASSGDAALSQFAAEPIGLTGDFDSGLPDPLMIFPHPNPASGDLQHAEFFG